MQKLRQRLAEQEGFTLIELLVVIVIIGILLAIAVPSYLGFKGRAEEKAAAANVRAAIPDAEAYYADLGNYTNMTRIAGDSPDAAGLKGIDSGVSRDPRREGRRRPATACPTQQGSHYAKVVGPGGTVDDSGHRRLRDRSRLVRTTSTMHVREGAGDRALPFACGHGTERDRRDSREQPFMGMTHTPLRRK